MTCLGTATFSPRAAWQYGGSRPGGWNGSKGLHQASVRLRTDHGRNPLSPPGSALAAAELRLAGLRPVSKISSAAGFSFLLATQAGWTAVFSDSRALKTDQAR